MYNQDEILTKIKSVVLEEIPDAKVYLFGSRVTGKIHEESDWDILVLSEKKYPKSVKRLTTKYDWENHPGYYSLQLGIADQFIRI